MIKRTPFVAFSFLRECREKHSDKSHIYLQVEARPHTVRAFVVSIDIWGQLMYIHETNGPSKWFGIKEIKSHF